MQALSTAVAFFAGTLLVYGFLARGLPRANRMVLFFFVGCAGGALLVGGGLVAKDVATIEVLASALSYALMCEVFLSCLGMSLTSVSASLLLRLRERPMDDDEIGQVYSSRSMVSLRLQRMADAGLVEEREGRLRLSEKGRRAVETFRFLQRLFRHAETIADGPARPDRRTG